MTNALKTGANGDTVDVTIACRERSIDIEVSTVGSFAPEVRSPAEREVEIEGGRGIPIMLALVDEVAFSRTGHGTRVRMRKRVAQAGEGHSALGNGDSAFG